MAIRTFGRILFDEDYNKWELNNVLPHVSIKLKAIFQSINKASACPFYFLNNPATCHDLLWFLERYPMDISESDMTRLESAQQTHLQTVKDLETILMPNYIPPPVQLKDGFAARDYQLKVAAFDQQQKRYLLGDDIGLGKTLEAILTLSNKEKLPALVVVQTHLPKQWRDDGVCKFTNLKAHILKGTKPYNLPPADVYITTYSKLAGWVDVFATGFFNSVIFDEVQELRISSSAKYQAAKVLSNATIYALGMSATPIYNFGDEIYNVLDLINPDCLGPKEDFLREWAIPHGQHFKVKNPQALGAYLRDNYLFLRRTREEVGRQLPPINKIVHTVGYDSKEVKRSEEIAQQLALKVVGGSFMERGQAARELDAFMRLQTGIAKAREVAAFVRILLENGEPVLLAGWHRDVYGIWETELWDHNPVFYTGTESPTQKAASKEAFVTGKTNLFIISLRSGIGLDGLQHRCKNVVVGELDWSPKVHEQLIGRVDRDGQPNQVNAYFLTCEFGSDPFIINLLGLKSSQSHGIINPFTDMPDQHSDESRIKALAESFLKKRNGE